MAGSLPQSGVSLIAQNAGQFISQMNAADKALGGFGKGAGAMSNIVTGAFRQVGALITNVLVGAAAAMGSWLKDSIGVAGDFEETLNVMGVAAGASAAQLDQVAAKAKELGADLELPATSAQDAADVMLELSKSGFSVEQAMDAAKGALQLAAAAETDAANAAQVIAGALNAFGLEATDATRITDLLAGAANASQASMTDLAQGLQQGGFAFHAAGQSVDDLATSLAILTKNNMTGSDSGTALKNAIMRLMNPTDKAAGLMEKLGFNAFDANGKMKPLAQIIGDLNRSLVGMTDQERNAALGTIFLSDGMKAMIPLLNLGEDGFNALKDKVTEEGQASAIAAAHMKGWNGAVASTTSQLETFQLIIGTLLKDALTPLLFTIGQIVAEVGAFADAMFSSADPLAFLIGQIDSVLPGFAEMTAAIGRVVAILTGELPSSASVAQAVLTAIRDTLVNVVIPAVTMAANWLSANLPAAITQAKAAFADLQAFIQTVMPTIQSIIATALALIQALWSQNGSSTLALVAGTYEAIKGLIQIVLGVIQGILAIALAAITGDWQSNLGTIQQANTTIWNGIRQFLSGILNRIAATFGTTLDEIVATWQHNWEMAKQIVETVFTIIVSAVTRKVNDIRAVVDNVIGATVALWSGLFNDLLGTISGVMSGAASAVSSNVTAIKGAFSGIIGVIDSVISAAKRLASALSNISVPDILSPGSPTPFQIGLEGIDKAMKQTTRTIQAQFTPALGGMLAAPQPMQLGPTTNTSYGPSYQMPIYTNQSPAALSQGLALVEALGR